jgi:hypothetical protein
MYKLIPFQRVAADQSAFFVARVKGVISLNQDLSAKLQAQQDESLSAQQLALIESKVQDQLTLKHKQPESILESAYQSFLAHSDRPSLFFRSPRSPTLKELQAFLETHNLKTTLVNKCLSFEDKVQVFFAPDAAQREQLQFRGQMCREYF